LASWPSSSTTSVSSNSKLETRNSKLRASAPFALAALLALSGCASFVSSGAERLAQRLGAAILDQDDPKTVEDGAPAYLLLVDGLAEDDPQNVGVLLAGARLYGAYGSVFVADAERAQRLSARARAYAQRALCQRHPAFCDLHTRRYDDYVAALAALTADDAGLLYTYGASWAGWIQANPGDWTAVADLPRVEATMRRVIELDEPHDRGGAHLYLGALASLLPPALGGRPEEARAHFERALEIAHGRNLTAKVMLAERYARTLFNRELHDRLLHEVLEASPREPGLTLMNVLAQRRARELLASADQYF
jgi:tetratricopeptide (TPR) repeat protein